MSDVATWIASRRPVPPADLARALSVRAGAGSPADDLTTAGVERLNAARARPGRVRDSAFRLLEADALITYACEAALEEEDPVGTLRRILASASA